MPFVCALSGEPCREPVISPVSGHVYERRLIAKFLAEFGKDPKNEEVLKEDQLIDLKTSDSDAAAVPRNLSTTSIPSLLKTMQDEWDALMLNNFVLRQNLQTARQELSHSLYQHDAACRVIARLQKELTQAREALATLRPQGAVATEPQASQQDAEDETMKDAQQGIPAPVMQRLEAHAHELTAARKQRGKTGFEGLTTPEQLATLSQSISLVGLHSTARPGITALSIKDTMALTGGVDKSVAYSDWSKERVIRTWSTHTKKISAVVLHPDGETGISASHDGTVRIFNVNEDNMRSALDAHEAAVTDISLHPTGDYLLTVGADAYWTLADIRAARTLCKIRSEDGAGIQCGQFHPDGLILCTGHVDSVVRIWDLKEQRNVANFPGHQGAVRAIAFSENGYYLATGADDGEVKLWDLRRLKNVKTLTIGDGKSAVNALHFDDSGSYLAVGAADVQVIHVKPWSVLTRLGEHTAPVTGVRFGANASRLISTSLDKSLRVFTLAS